MKRFLLAAAFSAIKFKIINEPLHLNFSTLPLDWMVWWIFVIQNEQCFQSLNYVENKLNLEMEGSLQSLEFTSRSAVKISQQRDKLKWQLNGNEIGVKKRELTVGIMRTMM